MISLDGDINTGITIRTSHLRDGIAKYAAGATLLYDSIPEMEEAETRLKATGFFRALNAAPPVPPPLRSRIRARRKACAVCWSINEDCFIHTLANYARQTGAEVMTYRAGFPLDLIGTVAPSLILVSPGPGRPEDFRCARADPPRREIGNAAVRRVPGLAGDGGGVWRRIGHPLDYPMHGKPSLIRHRNIGVFEGLPEEFRVGRYHSLYAIP